MILKVWLELTYYVRMAFHHVRPHWLHLRKMSYVGKILAKLLLELWLNSNSGIGIEIGLIENGIGIETPGFGIENHVNGIEIFTTGATALTS